jgi:hypothetical protein
VGGVHGDGLLLDLGGVQEVDQIVVRNVSSARAVTRSRCIAVGVRTRIDKFDLPASIRATADGNWHWTAAKPAIEAEVTAPGRAPKKHVAGQVMHELALGEEPLGVVYCAARSRLRSRRAGTSCPPRRSPASRRSWSRCSPSGSRRAGACAASSRSASP